MCFRASLEFLDCYLYYYTKIFTIPYLFLAVMANLSTPIPPVGTKQKWGGVNNDRLLTEDSDQWISMIQCGEHMVLSKGEEYVRIPGHTWT